MAPVVLSMIFAACGGAGSLAPVETSGPMSPSPGSIVSATPISPVVGPSATAPSTETAAGRAVYWASYEFHDEPKFRLLFEGGTPASDIDEVRVTDKGGTILASSVAVPVEEEPIRLCGRSTRYGTSRATIAVAEDLFDAFIQDGSKFIVQVRTGSTWTNANLANLCHATQ